MADDANTSTGTEQQTTTTDQTTAPAAIGAAPDATGTQPGKQAGPTAQSDARTFSQADVDRIVKERLERESSKAERAAAKAREEAEAKALAEQGKFKELAEQREKRIAELEAQIADLGKAEATAKRYEKALKEALAAQTANIPEHIRALLDKMEVTEQMGWLAANADKLKPAAVAAPADISATKRSASPNVAMSDDEAREFAARYGVRAEFVPKVRQ